ncbi:MAG TPA: histidine kinase, partial [Nocardioides sp.]|nr:histidine kinase [Nocardioides sp.]
IREQDQVVAGPAGRTELATAMVHLGSRPGVEVVTTGSVELASPVAAEALAVVGACLDNVRRHVGPDARAWVLLE